MAEPQQPTQQPANSDLSTTNFPTGTSRVENGVAYDVTGKSLGPVNAPEDQSAQPAQPSQPVDLVAAARAAGATPAPSPSVDLIAAAKAAGAVQSPDQGRKAPEQTNDILTKIFAYSKPAVAAVHFAKELTSDEKTREGLEAAENSALLQAKNTADYIYNNVLGKDTYEHSNLTYDQTPSSAMGKVWQRFWGWATQDEINKLPGIEPDRVASLQAQGKDSLDRLFGSTNGQWLRQHILNGHKVELDQEAYARAAAKSLTDFFSPGYYLLSGFGRVAQGYQKAAQLAAHAGDLAEAARAFSKARLLGTLSVGINLPFAASQAYDLVENWDNMNVPERVAAVSGILGAAINMHVGIQHLGGYREVGTNIKDATTTAGKATSKAMGAAADRVLQAAPDFTTAIERASQLTGRKYAEQKANIKAAAPELQAILNENPQMDGSPKKFADAIRTWLQQREQVMLSASGATQGSNEPVSPTLERDVRDRLTKFFSEKRGTYGNDQQAEEAVDQLMKRLQYRETVQGEGPANLRMPNAFEAENIRQGLNNQVKPQIGGEPTTSAYRAGAHEVVKLLREKIDNFYDTKGIENVKEFRQKEATLIDVADRLEAAQKRADDMGNGTIWSSLAKKYRDPVVWSTILFGSFHPLSFGALAPYLVGERVYHNFRNPGVNIRRAIELADPNAVATDIQRRPPYGPQLPPGGLPTPPAHPTQAAAAAHAVAPALTETPTNHQLNAQLATHFGEPLNHEVEGRPVTLEDRIEQVKNDAEAMRRSGIDISKTQTGKMLGLINEHEQVQAATLESEQQKAAEDAQKVAEELHKEYQRLQEEQTKKITGGKLQPSQSAVGAAEPEAFKTPFEVSDEELPLPEAAKGLKEYTPFNTRLHEIGHAIWNHSMGLRPFDVLSQSHPDAGDAHAVTRADISRLLNPDGSMNGEAVKSNLGDLIASFLAGGVAEEIHGGVPLEKNSSTHSDIETIDDLFHELQIPKEQRDRILTEAKSQLREVFTQPGMEELMTGFAAKRKAGLSPEYHFDETQINQLRSALDNLKKGGTDEPTKGGNAPRTGQKAGGVGEETEAGREAGGAPEVGRQGGHAGGGVASEEELARPGRFVKISRSGQPTDQTKTPDFNLGPGEAGYQVKPDGTYELKAGQETPATKRGVEAYSKEIFGKRKQASPAGLIESTTGDEEHDAAIRNGGGIPAGFMHVPGHGSYKMFHDPETGSTLTFKPSDAITPQTVGKKLAESRAEFAAGEKRAKAREAEEATAQKPFDSKNADELTIDDVNKNRWFINPDGTAVGSTKGWASTHQQVIDAGLVPKEGAVRVVDSQTYEIRKRPTEAQMRNIARLHRESGRRLIQYELIPGEEDNSLFRETASIGQLQRDVDQIWPKEMTKTEQTSTISNRLVETFGTTNNPHDAGFILSDGRMVPLKGEHNTMMETLYNKYGDIGMDKAERTAFINNEQAVRTRYRTGKGGSEIVFSVPKQGVTPEQVEQIKKSVGQLRNGNAVFEISEGQGKSAKKEFVRISDVEPALREIGALPQTAAQKLQPKQSVTESADEYNKSRGLRPIEASVKPHDVEFAKRVANAFDEMKNEPENPAVKKSYTALANEVRKQWDYATKEMGMKFEPWTKEGQPYANSKEMVDDVRNNKHLYFFQGGDIKPESPMAKVDSTTGLTYNDMFRAVHDLFGHAAHGFEFGPKGEENAYLVHRQMFPEEAIPALTSETRGQNSWVNFGPHLRNAEGNVPKKGEEGYVSPAQRPYAEQKVGLLPEQFHGVEPNRVPQEQTTGKYDAPIRKGGAIPGGIEKGDPEADVPDMALFHDPVTGSTLYLPVDRITPENVKTELIKSRQQFAAGERRKNWAKAVEQNPYGGVNPNDPDAPSRTYGFEIIPEHRHNPPALTAEEARAYAERPEVRSALAAHPDVKLGWDTTTNGPELNIGASTDDLDTAKKIAGKLDQRVIVNTKTGEEISAGGQGRRTRFPEYPIEQRLRDLKKSAPSEEGFEHIRPELLQHMEPDEKIYAKDNKRRQELIQYEYDNIKPSIDEVKAAAQAGEALGGWWRRYMDTFKALGKESPEVMAKNLGPSHEEALKAWHAAVSANKSVENANSLAWGTYADWLDAGRPRDRASIDRMVVNNGRLKGIAAVSDTHKRGKVTNEGVDTTKLFQLVNSPQMRDFNPEPFHGAIFDPENPSPIAGVTPGAHKLTSMMATVGGEGNFNRLVLDTHMLDFYGANKWTDNRYIAHSIHMRQAAKELGLTPAEAQEQIWGTVLGIKQLLYEGVPADEVPDELTSDVIKGIGKDYAEVIQNDPELNDIFERLKAHGIDPGGNEAQQRLRDIVAGKKAAGETPVDKGLLANTAERVRGALKKLPPEQSARFKFGANVLKLE